MSDDRSTPGEPDYEVGYGRPPTQTRFRKGRSGNPAGRPKGAKNRPKLTGSAINDVLRRELNRTVEVRGAEGPEVLSIFAASARALGVQAVKGNVRAQQQLIVLQRELDAQDAAERDARDRALFILRDRQLERRRLNRERGIEEDLVPDPDHIVMDRATARMVIRGPADLQQKVEWERMWGGLLGFRWEVERAWKKLRRLGPQHGEEQKSLKETIREFQYWVSFFSMRLMTVFSLEAWQVTEDSFEQQELDQRVREDGWPDPPPEIAKRFRPKELEALRRGEIYQDAIARQERWRRSGLPPFSFPGKPAPQEAFERQQQGRKAAVPPDGTDAASVADGSGDTPAWPTAGTWFESFPMLNRLEAEVRDALAAASTIVSVPAGDRLFTADEAHSRVFIILSGTVRVQELTFPDGFKRPAFDLGEGEPSVLKLTFTGDMEDYGADGIALTDVTAVAIGTEPFLEARSRSADFRMFLFYN